MKNDEILIEIKAEIEQSPTNAHGRVYSDDLKKKVVNYHYKTGKTMKCVSEELGMYQSNIAKWKKKFGKQRTVFTFGEGVRNDVRTKALAVQEYVLEKTPQHEIAKKYGVSQGTINTWIKNMKDNYEEFLDTRDGVPYIVKEEKMVFGDDNIKIVLDLKEKHMTELNEIIELMHKNGIAGTKTLQKEIANKKAKTKKEIDVLKEADKILAKEK